MPARWVVPKYVAEVKYAEITDNGRLRHPVFLRLRDGKPPERCTMQSQLPGHQPASSEARPPDSIRLTNPDKQLWPGHGSQPAVTKQMVADYFQAMAGSILAYTSDRPAVLNRFPDGIYGESFFQKNYDDPLPEGVHDFEHYSKHAERTVRYVVCSNQLTLRWFAQLANIELNCWTCRIDQPDRPDFLVFDLDPYITYRRGEKTSPYAGEDYAGAVQVARRLKQILDRLGLAAFVKTSGQTGLHVFVPIKREYSYA
jgi:bifunctional non-homologous end joining protein LigD